MPRPGLARRALAEAVATFALVFAGCGAIVVDAERGQALGAVGIGAVFGLVILAMVYATGHLSGAHINPAVTLAFTATRHFPLREAAAYVRRSVATLERWAALGEGPPFRKVGGKVLYPLPGLRRFASGEEQPPRAA